MASGTSDAKETDNWPADQMASGTSKIKEQSPPMSQLNFNLNLVTHWNVGGADFYDKHKFFESQFEQLDEFVEKVAEKN